jgi:hypothetical protein
MGAWTAGTAGTADMSIQTEIYKKPETVPKTSATANYTKNGASWSSGETKVLASYTVQASLLETLVATYGDGAWQLQFVGTVNNLKITIGGAQIDLPADSRAIGNMDFTYTNGVPTSLSIFGGSEGLTG